MNSALRRIPVVMTPPPRTLPAREVKHLVPAPAPSALVRLRERLPAWLGGTKQLPDSGVTFVGPTTAAMIRVALSGPGTAMPDAERLSHQLAFVTSAYCFVAMRWRSRRVAEPPLMVVKETEQGEEWQKDHPLADLLDAPRRDVDMGEMLERTQLYWDHTGGCVWWVQRNNGQQPALVTPFSAREFESAATAELIYGAYRVLTRQGWQPVPAGDLVVHFRDPSPLGWRVTTSLVDVALAQLDLGHQVNRIVRRYLDRAMFPGGVLSPDKDWHPTPEEWENWKAAVEDWYGGPANAGAPLMLPGGTTFSRAASGLTDLLPQEMLDRVEATVGSVFGVPPVVLGWLSGMKNSPWSQMGEARRAAYEETIEPLWRDYERRLSRVLLSPAERAGGLLIRFDTARVKAVQEDALRRSQIAGMNRDTWRIDERRLYTGQEPTGDERGDVIVGLLQAQTAGAAAALGVGKAAEAKAVAPTTVQTLIFPKRHWRSAPDCAKWATAHGFHVMGKPGVDETADSYRIRQREPGDFVAGSFRTICLMGATNAGDTACRVQAVVGHLKAKSREERDALWLQFDLLTKAAEVPWTRTVYAFLVKQRDELLRLAGAHLREKAAAAGATKVADEDAAHGFVHAADAHLQDGRKHLVAVVKPLLLETGGAAVHQAAARLGLSFTVLEPGLAKYAAEEAAFLADVMGEETGRQVAAAVQAGLMEGETVRQLTKRLADLPAFSQYRARLTARTETTRAWNGAQRRSLSHFAHDSGRRTTKSWLSARDDRVRPEHQALDDGTEVDIDQPFANGLMEPGEPNCRCTLVYNVAQAGAAGALAEADTTAEE